MQRPLLVFFCMIVFHATLSSRPAELRPLKSGLEISCSLSDRNAPLKEYTILILEDDTARDTIFADLAIPIYIQLDLGKSYVIEFSKPGFLERLVLIDTRVPSDKLKKRYSYDFEIDMPPAINDTGMYAIQPIARIMYDTINDGFTYDEEYARNTGNFPQMSTVDTKDNSQKPHKKKSTTKVARKEL